MSDELKKNDFPKNVAGTIISCLKNPVHTVKKVSFGTIKSAFNSLKKNGLKSTLSQIGQYLTNENTSDEKFIPPELITNIKKFTYINVPQFKSIDVSIIIPVYNQFTYTYNCIKSIVESVEDVCYEIILADDCSTDETAEISKYVNNIKIVRNEKNLRFTLNCNNAAKYASGKYILFLNNDTFVYKDWLKSLYEAIKKDSSIGLIGSKMLSLDGTIQEAGGIIWSDGSAWNYGRGKNRNLPEVNYLKEVDYISGASIMTPTELWKEIGGFDERYAPSYCEDSDYAFEVRKHGYKVVYQPRSVLVHYEGMSNGKSVESGLKAYQVTNMKKLYDKWETILKKEHFSNAEDVYHARDRTKYKKSIIVFDEEIPTFDRDAGSKTTYLYINTLVELGYNVKLMTRQNNYVEKYVSYFQSIGVETFYIGFRNTWKQWFSENGKYIDYALVNRPDVAEQFIPELKKYPNIKIIYNTMDLHYLRLMREYEIKKDQEIKKESDSFKEKELSAMNNSSVVMTVSTIECDIINDIVPGNKCVLAPGYYFDNTINDWKYSDNKTIMFVGGFRHRPNVNAIEWFMNNVWPELVEKIPDIKFIIVGSEPPEKIISYQSDNITITGYVSDQELNDYYSNCNIAIMPLQFGAGIKGKVLEAMSKGVPIVSTSIGLEGLVDIEDYVRPYDSKEDFTDAIIRYCENQSLSQQSSEMNVRYIKKYYSKDRVVKMFESILD